MFDPWIGKISWRRKRLPTPVFWPGEFHGLHSLWGLKESDTNERLPRSLPLWNSFSELSEVLYSGLQSRGRKESDTAERLHFHYSSCVDITQSCPTLCNPMDYTVHGILQARILEWVAFPFSRGSSQPRSPALQADSLPAEPQGKPKNTGVGSLSLLQGIFLTQESNQGLLQCRWILYQLSYQAIPE